MEVSINGITYVPKSEPRDDRVLLSVLVPSVGSRRDTFAPKILDMLYGQHDDLPSGIKPQVEILFLMDAKGMVLGDKRNAMVRMARGEYVVFVDDDDRVAEQYLATLHQAILLQKPGAEADCITFVASVSLDGAPPRPCYYSLTYNEDVNLAGEYHRMPNHICAIKRDLVLRTPFPAKLRGEDSEFAKALKPLLRTQHVIQEVLYFYDYNSATTETQKAEQPAVRLVKDERPPVADVVILAKTTNDEARAMTESAIRSCRATAGCRVNIIVAESIPDAAYDMADATCWPGAVLDHFGYNSYANFAARKGDAPWIVVSNNDVVFTPGWLDALIDARSNLASPVDPGHPVQSTIRRNESGFDNGRHLSGWCFMIARILFDKIGGLDEDFDFWCADDSLIEQVRALGVKPMIVPAAKVVHYGSRTLDSGKDDGAMTWAQVAKFEAKYGRKKFVNDPRYKEWKGKHNVA